ncbi:MAG: hypothetical protein J5642_06720 [Bacteroidales bacterium]|nr:hypothetical protein [Bacteroidales bacterium]
MNMRGVKLLLVFLVIALLSPVPGMSQGKKIYFQADLLEYDEDLLPGVEQYTGNVVFRHGKTIGYCSRAEHYRNENRLIAYGNPVRVQINDSVTLYGQRVFYDGEARTVSISRKVRLVDKSAALYTDSMTYDLDEEMGYYLVGGRMVSDSNVLTSHLGYYYTQEKMAYLRDSVHFVNETYTGDCDNASFNTQTEVIYFTSRTHMFSDESEAFTDGGWYDTQQEIVLLVGNAELHNREQELSGDSLYFENNSGFGQGWYNVRLEDSVKNFIVQGHYLEYKDEDYAIVTDSSLLILVDKDDSLFLHADTLYVVFDSTQHPQQLFAYNHVKFFRQDMQGACDSMTYHVEDSLITMYFNPVVWSGENQLTADTIRFHIVDSLNVHVHLRRSAFVASSLYDETEFNQVKGLNIMGYIHDRKLSKVEVMGNAECLYFVQEEDSSLIGVNSVMTSEMAITLDNNEIQYISFYNAPDGKLYPDQELDSQDRRLKNFRWLRIYRPDEVRDIFTMPVVRVREEESGLSPDVDGQSGPEK